MTVVVVDCCSRTSCCRLHLRQDLCRCWWRDAATAGDVDHQRHLVADSSVKCDGDGADADAGSGSWDNPGNNCRWSIIAAIARSRCNRSRFWRNCWPDSGRPMIRPSVVVVVVPLRCCRCPSNVGYPSIRRNRSIPFELMMKNLIFHL